MSKVYTSFDYDYWTVGIADSNAKLGMQFQDSDDQQVIHEIMNHATLDDAVNYIKNEYGSSYDKLVENHGVFYTDELATVYPKEIEALGWCNIKDQFKAFTDIPGYVEDIGVESDISDEKDFGD